jgi:stage IV sporulation protein FA
MEIRDKGRKRYLEYIQQRQEDNGEEWNRNKREMEDPLMSDPEYVWNRKWRQEYSKHKDYINDDGGSPFRPSARTFLVKLFLSCIIFSVIGGLFQLNHPWANKVKSTISLALNNTFDFQTVALWYERQFGGNPSLLPAWLPGKQQEAQKVTADTKHYFSPVKGKVIAPYEPSRLGITLETRADATVAAFDTGLVIYTGSKEDTGYTVIIRHTNGLQSVYGWVEQSKVELNDWVKGGETIGTVSKNSSKQAGYLYFAVSKDNRFLNPADVVGFD